MTPVGKRRPSAKTRARLVDAVAVAVLEQLDTSGGDVARADAAVGIAAHLGDEEPALLVEGHRHRIDDVRLGGDEVDFKIFGDAKSRLFLARRQRLLSATRPASDRPRRWLGG